MRLVAFLCFTLLIISCQKKQDSFQHDLGTTAKPWTHAQFDNSEEKFTFAIFSDLTGGERPGVFNVAVAQLNLLRPEMIINVGDLIEGGAGDSLLNAQWDAFDQKAQKAKAPVFYVGGNHDLGSEEMWQVWDERLGQRYYHFVYKNVLFLVLNTEDNTPERMEYIAKIRLEAIEIGKKEGWDKFSETEYAQLHEQSAGNIGTEQSEYFISAIEANPNVLHTFLFMHKAPWTNEDKEFVAIEDALAKRPYTVFNGHVHAYEYEQRKGRDYIRLATTGGVQFPEKGRSADHITLVTVDKEGVDIANLLMTGILDKKGRIPQQGDTLCFEKAVCNSSVSK
ncbi:MAG: metallophosphoesterase [Reichenbachiella sp.]